MRIAPETEGGVGSNSLSDEGTNAPWERALGARPGSAP